MYFPSTKATKDAIRNAIGVSTTFVIQGSPTACSICEPSGYDPVNESSLDPFCPECSGLYWITEDDNIDLIAHVRWSRGDELNRDVAGMTLDGDCSVTIGIDDLTTEQLGKIKQVIVDGRTLEVYRSIYRGVPERDRIRITCKEFGKEES